MTQINVAILAIGGSVLVLGLFSKLLKQRGIPDPMLLFLLGCVLGPEGLGLLRPQTWGDPMIILEQASRLTLAVGLMGVALRLPSSYTRGHWKQVLVVLLVSMPFMWLSSSLVIGLLLGFSLWPALLIGAIITPTDPVVASSIVTGPVAEENLPWPLRRLISSESGLNDGLGYAFVLLPILAIDLPPAEAARVWFLRVLLWEIAGAVVLGILFGYAAGHMLKFVERRKMIEEPSIVAYTTALALTTLSAVNLMGSDGILAVFVCGIAFDQTVAASDRESESRVVEGVDRFFTLPIFGLLGLLAPWQQWLELGWTCVALALVILVVRRLPLFLVLGPRIQDMQKTPDYIFAGWFGPIGVAALYYVALAAKQSTVPQAWPIVSLIVSFSIVVHGLTATPFTRLYSRFTHP